MVAFS